MLAMKYELSSSDGILSGGCAEGIPALQSMRWESEEAPLQDGR